LRFGKNKLFLEKIIRLNTYLISDIHGYNIAFRKVLKKVALKKSDTLIILGDVIDRGPDSKGVIDTILLLKEHGFDVRCLKGNHEELFLNALDDISSKVNWIRNGGKDTLQSFLTSDVNLIPEKYINFIKTFEDYIILDDYILVHAGLDMTKEAPFEDLESLLWLRDWESVYDEKWLGHRKIIHGHTPKSYVDIENQFNSSSPKIWSIDSGVYLREDMGFGRLCIMELGSNKAYFQKVKE
jgi:serine/threonine protein phosphatase 1